VASVRLAIKLRPALALRLTPSLFASVIGIGPRHIDLDSAGQKVTAAVDRGDAAVAARNLTFNDTGGQNRKEKAEKGEPAPIARRRRWIDGTSEPKGKGRNHHVFHALPKSVGPDKEIMAFIRRNR